MTPNKNDELAKSLSYSLNITSDLVNSLLVEIRQNSTSLAVLKEKFEVLKDGLNKLTEIIENENEKGSIMTRLALVEQALNNVEEQTDDYQNKLDDELNKSRKDKRLNQEMGLTKLKIALVAIPGIVSFLILIIKLILGLDTE